MKTQAASSAFGDRQIYLALLVLTYEVAWYAKVGAAEPVRLRSKYLVEDKSERLSSNMCGNYVRLRQ